MGDELLALVLGGRKRATACLLRDIETGGEMMARVSAHVVALDGGDRPRAIWKTRTVDVKPLRSTTPSPGTRATREKAMHTRYFEERASAEGFAFTPSMPAVFERFTVVWPPGDVDVESA